MRERLQGGRSLHDRWDESIDVDVNDIGAMLRAAAAQTPCAGIFSSRNWAVRCPYKVEPRVFRSEIVCEGCYMVEFLDRQNECPKRVPVAEVIQTCAEVLPQHLNKSEAFAHKSKTRTTAAGSCPIFHP